MAVPTFRFAPSPNGYLHLGHALSALLNFDMASAAGGRFLLRIEDIDRTRCRPEFEAAIYEDLAWLGIAWERPVRRQSEHFAAYGAQLEALEQQGLLYTAFETRAELARAAAAGERAGDPWPRDPDGAPLYRRTSGLITQEERARRMAAGEPSALRLDMGQALSRAGVISFVETGAPAATPRTIMAAPEVWGDVVLARKETPTSYHLSVVVDDALQGVTHVVRGNDLYAATGLHRLLQTLLGFPAPTYGHHGLILDEGGRKLAKSTGATALRALREKGATPQDIRRMVGLA